MLINCAVYQQGRKVADIDIGDIAGYTVLPDSFVWVALKDPDEAELLAMQKAFGLHELAVEDARKGEQRPKLEEYGECLFSVMQTLEIVDGELNVGEVEVFAGPHYVVSVRQRTQRGFSEVRARSEREPDLLRHGPGYVLYALLDAVVDRYFPVLEALEVELEATEQRIFSGQSTRASVESLYELKHKLMELKHAVGSTLEAVGKLHGGRVPRLCAPLQDYFRDVHDHLVRLNQSIDAAREMVTTAVSVNLSLVTLQENEVTKRLASYGALVAVPTLIAGIYGMNFQHMPELSWQYGYPLTLAAMVGIDVYLFYRFRKARWL
jgi:magnesium transporter